MQTRTIGSLNVSVAGLGTNNFGRRIDLARTQQVVDAAIEAGITLFDTADLYGEGASEEFLGRTLGNRRNEVVITTKFGMGKPGDGLTGGHPTWVARACEASLKRLETDRIDLYLLHTPDAATPIADTLEAMNSLVDQGKVVEIGCSNFSVEQLEQASEAATQRGFRPFSNLQNQYSLFHREPENGTLDVCARLSMSFVPFFPLASGLLSGKYRRGEVVPRGTRLGGDGGKPAEEIVDVERLDIAEKLTAFATSRGHTILELALSWLAEKPTVASVIAGATSPEQVRANAAATLAWNLSRDELQAIDELVGATLQ